MPDPLKRTPRKWAYDLLDPDDNPPFYERVFNLLLAALILITVVIVIVDTVPELHPVLEPWMETIRWIAIVFFGAEYLGRIWVVPERPGGDKSLRARLAWILSPLALIDLLVILSLAFPELPAALGALRALRLLKLLSLLKLGRTSPALKLIGQVLVNRLPELKSLVVTIVVLVTIAASMLYAIESEAGTKGFESIPHAMWWAIVTLTTTGYGDVFPATGIGRLLAATIMLLGVGVVALPAGIIATGFAEAARKQREQGKEEDPRLTDLQDTVHLLLPHLPPESREVAERALERSRT